MHGIVSRGSVDIDFSISGQFDDLEDIQRRIFRGLETTFLAHSIKVFDLSFKVVPPILGADALPWWGGYVVEFKLIDLAKYDALKDDIGDLQRQSLPVDTRQGRRFRIDISKHEYCRDKVRASVAGQTIFVYSEEMCVFEKYRSLCQQMPAYQIETGTHARPRGRDFYDIYATITRRAIDIALPENLSLCRSIFEAKHVPLRLISDIEGTREFHRADWDAVTQSVSTGIFDFDFYFDFVVDEANKLKPLWME